MRLSLVRHYTHFLPLCKPGNPLCDLSTISPTRHSHPHFTPSLSHTTPRLPRSYDVSLRLYLCFVSITKLFRQVTWLRRSDREGPDESRPDISVCAWEPPSLGRWDIRLPLNTPYPWSSLHKRTVLPSLFSFFFSFILLLSPIEGKSTYVIFSLVHLPRFTCP